MLVLVLDPRGFSPGTPVSPLLKKNEHSQIPIRSDYSVSRTLSLASGSGVCVMFGSLVGFFNHCIRKVGFPLGS